MILRLVIVAWPLFPQPENHNGNNNRTSRAFRIDLFTVSFLRVFKVFKTYVGTSEKRDQGLGKL